MKATKPQIKPTPPKAPKPKPTSKAKKPMLTAKETTTDEQNRQRACKIIIDTFEKTAKRREWNFYPITSSWFYLTAKESPYGLEGYLKRKRFEVVEKFSHESKVWYFLFNKCHILDTDFKVVLTDEKGEQKERTFLDFLEDTVLQVANDISNEEGAERDCFKYLAKLFDDYCDIRTFDRWLADPELCKFDNLAQDMKPYLETTGEVLRHIEKNKHLPNEMSKIKPLKLKRGDAFRFGDFLGVKTAQKLNDIFNFQTSLKPKDKPKKKTITPFQRILNKYK